MVWLGPRKPSARVGRTAGGRAHRGAPASRVGRIMVLVWTGYSYGTVWMRRRATDLPYVMVRNLYVAIVRQRP